MIRTLLALLMALCLPFQGLGQAAGRITAPAHYHVGVDAQGQGGRVAHQHQHQHRHQHEHDQAGATALGPLVDHHAHALDDDDVVYVADAHDSPSQGGSSAKTPPLDGVLQGEGWVLPLLTPAERVFSPSVGVSFSSHVDGPLRRPPRSRALS